MRALPMVVRLAAMLQFLGAIPASAHWKLEQDVEPPSYAVIEPGLRSQHRQRRAGCKEAGDARVLQLQIYLSTEGPLLLKGATAQQLKDDPHAEIVIDGRVFPVGLLFADTYAVLADETNQMFPRLSERLIDAMTTGRIMVLRFDLLAERAGQPASFDGEAVIALHSVSGAAAIVSAVRRCATVTVGAASAGLDRR